MRIEIGIVVLTAALVLVTPLAYAVITAIPSATAIVYTGGTLRGWNDGYRDYHGKGWDPSCPTGHGAVYFYYKSGYNAGWSVAFGHVTDSQLWQSQPPRGQSQSTIYPQQQQTATAAPPRYTRTYLHISTAQCYPVYLVESVPDVIEGDCQV